MTYCCKCGVEITSQVGRICKCYWCHMDEVQSIKSREALPVGGTSCLKDPESGKSCVLIRRSRRGCKGHDKNKHRRAS